MFLWVMLKLFKRKISFDAHNIRRWYQARWAEMIAFSPGYTGTSSLIELGSTFEMFAKGQEEEGLILTLQEDIQTGDSELCGLAKVQCLVKFMVHIYDSIIWMGSFMRIDVGSVVIYQEQYAVRE